MTDNTGTPYIGRSLMRREDRRLLTGQGQFVADLVLPRMLHAVLVRSPVAHARIRSVDLSRAAAAPGVVGGDERRRSAAAAAAGARRADLAAAEMDDAVQHKFLNPQQPLLAHDKARHVGEALAIIVAETREAGRGCGRAGRRSISRSCRRWSIPRRRSRPAAPIVHERFDTNLIGEFSVGQGRCRRGDGAAPHRLKRRFYHHRYAAVPMECRGVVADYDRRTDSVTIWSSTQVVHWVRREAARLSACPRRGCAASRPMSAAASAARAMSIPRTC